MATSSILGGERAAAMPSGKDTDALGPSDSSDSGSDMVGICAPGSDSDAAGTGERGSAVPQDEVEHPGSDIAPDRVVTDPDGTVNPRRPGGAARPAQRDRRSAREQGDELIGDVDVASAPEPTAGR